ncbi:MAG: NAD(P)-dependent oxidoreductase [Chloroflexi bacterium]|nr:NAD(P)-dependent oxidoreductase [Chloroflexota bacterium]
MKLGYIGLGNMGRPMADRLLKASHQVVGHNRSKGKQEAFVKAGGTGAASPKEVAAQCEVVHTCLTLPPDSDDVYLGQNGLIPHARPGQVFIEHSTIFVEQSKRLAAAAKAKGVSFLDAPVSGGPDGSAAGTLSIMLGGDAQTFQRVKPLLDVLAKNVYHCGPVGSGTAVKLANNMMVAIHYCGMVEGLVMATKAGVDPKLAYEIFKNSSSSSRTLTGHGHRMVSRQFDPRLTMKIFWKDLTVALQAADELGVRTLMARMAREVFQEARLQGYTDADPANLVRPLEKLTGVTLG